MSAKTVGLCGIVAIALCGLFGAIVAGQDRGRGQGQGQAQGQGRGNPVPTQPKVWTAAQLNAEAAALVSKTEPAVNFNFFTNPAYNTEMRRLKGTQPVLVHGKRADFMIMREGEGTFTAGGELVDGKPGGAEGEMTGTSIRNGVSTVLKPGDVMFIPAGIPHHFSEIKDHVTFIFVRWDMK